MKTVVLAYHNMGLVGLNALARHGFDILAVFTHEDDPQENCWFGSVRNWAINKNIPCFTTESINDRQWKDKIAAWQPDVLFSFYYRKMIGQEILDIPKIGAFNLHGSLLPAYRGRCPVNWVLVKGERQTGVTLHYMVEKPDAGDIVGQKAVVIDFEDTAQTLYDKLCDAAGRVLDDVLPDMKKGRVVRIRQDLSKGSYYGGRKPEDGRIDWNQPANDIYNLIRAVTDPYPGAFAFADNGEKIIIWWGVPESSTVDYLAGDVFWGEQEAFVKTKDQVIKLIDIEASGKRIKGADVGKYLKTRKVNKLT